MAHDINNYNQSSLGYIENEKQKKFLSNAFSQIMASTNLIENVRKLSKLKSEKRVVLENRDLRSAIERNIDRVKDIFREEEIEVNTKFPEKDCTVRADDLIDDLILNILTNAVKFDCSDRVVIDIKVEDARIESEEYWEVSVADRG